MPKAAEREAWEAQGYRRGWDAAEQAAPHWRRRAELAETLVTEMRLALDLARTTPGCFEGCTREAGHLGSCLVNPVDEADREDAIARVAIACGWQPDGDPAWPWRLRASEDGWMQARTAEAAVEAELDRVGPAEVKGTFSPLRVALRTGFITVGQSEDPERLRRRVESLRARLHACRSGMQNLSELRRREKKGRRKLDRRLAVVSDERDRALVARLKAERACEALRRERDRLLKERRDCLACNVEAAQAAIDAERESKDTAVRALRVAIAEALRLLANDDEDVAPLLGSAESALLRALRDVYDPDEIPF